MHPQETPSAAIALPDIPALTLTANEAHLLTTDGELKTLSHPDAKTLLYQNAAFVCHAPFTRKRLGLEDFFAFDVLELFAFVHPTRFCVPTPKGLCDALGLSAPTETEDYPFALIDIARVLLADLRHDPWKAKADPLKISGVMGLRGKGWSWSPFVFDALGEVYDPQIPHEKGSLSIWKNLPEWAEDPPGTPAGHEGISETETQDRLQGLLGEASEKREQQAQYAHEISTIFQPVQEENAPHVTIAEAGTGTGKTLGYLAPASVWAEKNAGAVWLSTYTKNLQRQIDQELSKLYPDPDLKNLKVAVRKGRENYLCLLNLEDLCAGASTARTPEHAIAAGIMARWAAVTKDGDLSGADFPGWLTSLLAPQYTLTLADRRGECIYSACDHYHRCFVERSIRKSKRARLVIANHALVMIQSASSTPISGVSDPLPTRYIFDEGHHLFNAADSAFAAHLTARESRDLRRWILGAEGGGRSRARGLKRRLEDLVADDPKAHAMLQDILRGAEQLTAEGWSKRLKESDPYGPCEKFLGLLYKQIFMRADGRDTPYSLETTTFPLLDDVAAQALLLKKALMSLQKPMNDLAAYLWTKLAEDKGDLNADTRKRMDAVASSLQRRSQMTLAAWIGMLDCLISSSSTDDVPQQVGEHSSIDFIDWLEITRIEGRAIDVGYYRHFTDPMKPFAAAISPHLHGMAITSATLSDDGHDPQISSAIAATQTGAAYLTPAPSESNFPSPFDYVEQSRVFVISDVNRNDLRQVAGAYHTLFEASDGGALGLFTAIQRLKAVHEQIAPSLEEDGIPLYAQHIEDIDAGSLIDMFREDEQACLLGTDAIRDGVDVPGRSLRLLVFDRVPWPRPTILHKARREFFAKQHSLPARAYDERLTRMKIKQAYGRLIRRATDKGVFVMLDTGFPSRLHNAFPADVPIVKCGLQDAKYHIKKFLHD